MEGSLPTAVVEVFEDDDLLKQILQHLPSPPDAAAVSKVCHRWRRCVQELVTRLDIKERSVYSILAANYPNTTSLDLSCVERLPSIASELSKLNRLRTLRVRECEEEPEGIRSLSELVSLDEFALESYDEDGDGVCAELAQLTRLTSLALKNCGDMTVRGLESIASLLELRSLSLGGCSVFRREELASLSALTRLTALSLIGMRGREAQAALRLALPSGLLSLEMEDRIDSFNDETASRIASLTGLTRLDLCGCDHLSDVSFASLAALKSLHHLRLIRCRELTLTSVSSLVSLTKLTYLHLLDCSHLCDRSAQLVASLSGLQTLGLTNWSITDAGVAHLAHLTKLTDLTLAYAQSISSNAILSLRPLERLVQLDLRNCNLSEEIADTLASFTRMRCLVLPIKVVRHAEGSRVGPVVPPERLPWVTKSISDDAVSITVMFGRNRGPPRLLW